MQSERKNGSLQKRGNNSWITTQWFARGSRPSFQLCWGVVSSSSRRRRCLADQIFWEVSTFLSFSFSIREVLRRNLEQSNGEIKMEYWKTAETTVHRNPPHALKSEIEIFKSMYKIICSLFLSSISEYLPKMISEIPIRWRLCLWIRSIV